MIGPEERFDREDAAPSAALEPESEPRALVEAVLDNLSAWAFIALAIAALFMVWATLVILETYVGGLPSVKP
jgi:hypothetical protein